MRWFKTGDKLDAAWSDTGSTLENVGTKALLQKTESHMLTLCVHSKRQMYIYKNEGQRNIPSTG